MNKDAYNTYVQSAVANPALQFSETKLAYFPYFDIMAKEPSLATVFISRVTASDGQHTVITSYLVKDGEADFSIWCGDKFAEARGLNRTDAQQRCDEAAGKTSVSKASLTTQLMSQYGAYSVSDACSFWKTWRKDKKLCEHTEGFLAHLRDTKPDFQDQLKQAYESILNSSEASAASGNTLSLEELAFRVPVLYEGERGAGKTMAARAYAKTNGYKRVEFGGHEGLESPDLLGYLVPYEKGSMVWKDGPISEAFRAAQSRKVVLIIDEMLRIRQRELSILLTALSPDEGVYRLRTGRIKEVVEGVAFEEELECPMENLCIIATTNVGSEYAVDDLDPALAERFVILRKDTTPEELKRILTLYAKARAFSLALVDQCMSFYGKMVKAKTQGLVQHAPTTRTMARCFELATVETDVRRVLLTQMLLWVARDADGHPIPEQVADVSKMIERCLK